MVPSLFHLCFSPLFFASCSIQVISQVRVGFISATLHSAGNFGDDEWMRQLQQQMTQGETTMNSPQPNHQFRHIQYDQNSPLPMNKNASSRTNEMDVSRQSAASQVEQNMPRTNSIDGLHQHQGGGMDTMAAVNSLLQQQQQQQSSLPNNLQQHQLQPQSTQPNAQQLSNLHENLIQLQKLQEQQQQILRNISQNTGLVDPNSIMNPLGTLLTTLVGQMSGNTNSNNSGSTAMNSNSNSVNTVGNQNPNTGNGNTWNQMSGGQQALQVPQDNAVHNPLPSMLPPIQQQQQQPPAFVARSNAPLEPPQPLRLLPTATRRPAETTQRKRYVSNTSLTKPGRAPSRDPSRGNSPNTNINIEFPSAPIIRKSETSSKKQRPKSFPQQLWDAMMTEGPMNDDAFEWLPDGKSFVVVDSEFFCKEILDRKFKQSKYGSFVRKLHRWGFIRLTSGTGTDCFHHPLFQRLRPELVSQIKCNSRNGKDGGKKGHNAYSRGEYLDSVQPSLMGVEKFIRAKVVTPETEDPFL